MNRKEAEEWVMGTRSMVNVIPQDPLETWTLRVAEADAFATQQAYWTLRAWSENLIRPGIELADKA